MEATKKSRIRSAFSSVYNTSPAKVVARTRKVQSPVYFTTTKVTVSIPVPHVRMPIVRANPRDLLGMVAQRIVNLGLAGYSPADGWVIPDYDTQPLGAWLGA